MFYKEDMMNENQLDNLLVRQKDSIILDINTITIIDQQIGENIFISPMGVERVKRVISQLKVLQELWNVSGYGYKGIEISEQLICLIERTLVVLESNKTKEATLSKLAFMNAISEIKELKCGYM